MSAAPGVTPALRVLIVDDSRTSRAVLSEICTHDPDMSVVGEAADGEEAVDLTARLHPDVVVMDITMPRLDGFGATRRIMATTPTPVVLVTAANDPTAVDVAMRALEAGALTVLAKPDGPLAHGGNREAERFRARVKLLSQVKVIRRYPDRLERRRGAVSAAVAGGPAPKAIAVAASTGGPQALCRFLTPFAADFTAPILIVQHIVRGFITGLVSWLDDRVDLHVKVAAHGESLKGGTVYVAPDDAHLSVTATGRVALDRGPAVGGFRPSATPLFEAAARVYGDGLIAVVLTGMGSDGLHGARTVRDRGGTVLAQDQRTSVVFGMPGVVIAAGLASGVGDASELAHRILRDGTGRSM